MLLQNVLQDTYVGKHFNSHVKKRCRTRRQANKGTLKQNSAKQLQVNY